MTRIERAEEDIVGLGTHPHEDFAAVADTLLQALVVEWGERLAHLAVMHVALLDVGQFNHQTGYAVHGLAPGAVEEETEPVYIG